MEKTGANQDQAGTGRQDEHERPIASDIREVRALRGEADFLSPFLERGMSLLVCGCGGSDTVSALARFLAPGWVDGIDLETSGLRSAISLALGQGLTNVSFKEGNLYELPVRDCCYDAVLASTHLRDPRRALCEMHRALKPGGVAGLRYLDDEQNVALAGDPLLGRSQQTGERFTGYRGANSPFARGREALMRNAGFVDVSLSVSERGDRVRDDACAARACFECVGYKA
jgi:SAM-dependent methyltransferase